MNIDLIEIILRTIILIFLIGSFVIFALKLRLEIVRKEFSRNNYSFVFSLFILSWVFIEILSEFIGGKTNLFHEASHFAILLLFAIWINYRFIWVFQKVKEI